MKYYLPLLSPNPEWQDLYLACSKMQNVFLRKASERLRAALGR